MRLTKKDVSVLALGALGGATAVIDTEDAAIAAHEIDRDAFGWKKYPERIDLDTVRTTLRHEGEAKNPRIEGSIQNGWHLTPHGVAWVGANQGLLGDVNITVAPTSAAAQRWRAETRGSGAAVNRVRTSEAFRLWTQGREFTPREAGGVFRIDEYTPAKDRTRKAAQLQELTRGDKDIEAFMKDAIPAALELRAPAGRQDKENQ
ncbi:hypothetical protein LZG07_16540 [Microbacterium profundi]|uniref:hypothetical protein n=1 Tax=Microbacterium profundi TaxID=450380 RepID=UPI001F305769|nr:hypothetical protein [Microbacterium profundi]MCE7483507.1 hypothetical protein [Microbacterium profundi]